MRASLFALLAGLALALPAQAPAATPGSADVAALQAGLTARGLYDGDVDGFAGPLTAAAVKEIGGADPRGAELAPFGLAAPPPPPALRQPPHAAPIRLAKPIGSVGTDGFGPRGDKFHTGIDYPAAMGTPVAAAGDGTVVTAGIAAGYG